MTNTHPGSNHLTATRPEVRPTRSLDRKPNVLTVTPQSYHKSFLYVHQRRLEVNVETRVQSEVTQLN